jgi:hypothetical protein
MSLAKDNLSSLYSYPSPEEKRHVITNIPKANATSEKRAMMITFQNASFAQMTMFRAWWHIHFAIVTIMPIAMMRDDLLFIGIHSAWCHRRCWKNNRTDDRVDRCIRDHREEQIAEKIVNDVETEAEMKHFSVGELIVIDGGKNDA